MQKTRTFLLRDKRHPQDILATLVVEDKGSHRSNTYTFHLTQDKSVHVPIVLSLLEKHTGSKTITGKRAADWIASRVPPPDRQNIREILDSMQIKTYDPWQIFLFQRGRCTRDHLFLEEVQNNDTFSHAEDIKKVVFHYDNSFLK